jgi:hypothetical protein
MQRLAHLLTTLSYIVGDASGCFFLAGVGFLLLGLTFRRVRKTSANLLASYSILQGAELWLWCLALLLTRFKLWVLLVGLLFLGVGIIPAALLGCLFTGLWRDAASIAFAGAFILAVKIFAVWYEQRFAGPGAPPRIPAASPAELSN